MIALKLVFNAEDALSLLVTLSSSWKAVYFLLHVHWCLYYLDNTYIWAYTASTIDWMGPHFWWYFWFLRPVSLLVLVTVQFLLAMNFARPQLLLFRSYSFRSSSAILHFVEPNLSGGPLVSARPVVMSAFYADAIKCQEFWNFGAKLNVWNCFEDKAKCLKLLTFFQCKNPLLVWNPRKPARLAKNHVFGQ